MNKQPILRRRNWLFELLVLAEGAGFIFLWFLYFQNLGKAIFCGCATYFVVALGLRHIFQKHHRRGMAMIRCGNYPEAAAAFQDSYDFLTAHVWVDKLRFLTMLSSSAIPYRDMALNNMGICYLHMNQPQQALEVLEQLNAQNSKLPNFPQTIEMIRKHMENGGAE